MPDSLSHPAHLFQFINNILHVLEPALLQYSRDSQVSRRKEEVVRLQEMKQLLEAFQQAIKEVESSYSKW